MSFPKAKIERFNDVKSCAPPLGSYDPKLPSLAGTGGHALYRLPRFNKENVSQNIPVSMTPTATSDTRKGQGFSSCRPGPSMSAPRRLPGASLSIRSSSTFSLPSAIERTYQQPDTEPEFEVRTFRNMDQEFLQEHNAELQDLKDQKQKSEIENEQLLKQLEIIRQDLSDAEARIVESDRVVEDLNDQLRQHEEKLGVILASQEAWKHQATNANQKNVELQQNLNDLHVQIQEKEKTILSIRASTDKVHEENLALLEKLRQSEESSQAKFQQMQEELDKQLNSNNELQMQLRQNTNKIDEISASVLSWKQEAEGARGEIDKLNSCLEENAARCNALESLLKESQDKTDALSSAVAEHKKCESDLQELQSHVRVLNEKLIQRDTELANALAVTEDYKTQSEQQRSSFDEMFRSVNGLQLQIKILDELNNQKDQELYDAQQNLEIGRKQISSLQADLEMREAELAKSEISLQTCSSALNEERYCKEETMKALVGSKAEIETLKSDHLTHLKELQLTIKTQDTELEQIKSELTNQCTTSSQLNEQLSKTCNELEACQNALQVSSSYITKIELQLNEKSVELEEIKATSDEYKLERENAHNAVEELERVLTNEAARVTNMEKLITEKDAKLAEAIRTIAVDQDELLAIKSALETTKAELTKLTLQLRSTTENLNDEINMKETVTGQLKEAKDKIQCQITEHEEQTKLVLSLQTQISAQDLHAQSQQQEIAAERVKSQQLLCQLDEKCEELQACQNKLNGCTYQIEELQLELTDKDMEMNVVKASVDAWKMHTDVERKKNQELQQNLADQVLTIAALEKSVAEKDQKLASVLKVQDEERAQLEILTAKLDVTEVELADVEKSLEKANGLLTKEIQLKATLFEELEEMKARYQAALKEKEVAQTEFLQRAAESELKMTSQSIKIAELKNELDEVQCTANQLKSHLNERTDQLEKTTKDLESTGSSLEEERARFATLQSVHQQLCNETEVKDLELTAAVENGKLWQSRYEEAKEDREKHIQRLKQAEVIVEEFLALQLKEATHKAELKESETKICVLKNSLQIAEQNVLATKKNLASSATEIASHLAARDKWKVKYQQIAQELDEHVQVCRAERNQSAEKLESYEGQITKLETVNASLKNLIGPFEDQLNLYKATLDAEKDTAASYKEKVSCLLDEKAKLMGHQNPKQKIYHLQKLKEENDKLLSKVFTLEKELKVRNKQVYDFQMKSGKIEPRRIDPSQAFQHRKNNNIDPENAENVPV